MHTSVNRKWLNENCEAASVRGRYFAGMTTREIAHSIVLELDMHPTFVGKLDQLVTSLVGLGAYSITDGLLERNMNFDQPDDVLPTAQIDLRVERRRRQHEREAAAASLVVTA